MTESFYFPNRPDHSALNVCSGRYESDVALAQYCDAHYGPDKFGVVNFCARISAFCLEQLAARPRRRALDLGCAVGRASLELARGFDRVDGVDFSARFIALARRLQGQGRIRYQHPEEGEVLSDCEVSLADFDLTTAAPRVTFHQGNAQNLAPGFADYDLILAANLIDRLPDPGDFLATIHRRLAIGGILAIASPYAWQEEFTPRRYWLGGRFRAGAPVSSLAGLEGKLARHFTAADAPREVEFVIRETARTYQHNIAQLTFWLRTR